MYITQRSYSTRVQKVWYFRDQQQELGDQAVWERRLVVCGVLFRDWVLTSYICINYNPEGSPQWCRESLKVRRKIRKWVFSAALLCVVRLSCGVVYRLVIHGIVPRRAMPSSNARTCPKTPLQCDKSEVLVPPSVLGILLGLELAICSAEQPLGPANLSQLAKPIPVVLVLGRHFDVATG